MCITSPSAVLPMKLVFLISLLSIWPVRVICPSDANRESAVRDFARTQEGVSAVVSVVADPYAGMGGNAYLVAVSGAGGREEILSVFTDGITVRLLSRDPALAGLILNVDEGVDFDAEFDRAALREGLEKEIKRLKTVDGILSPRAIRASAMQEIGRDILRAGAGDPWPFNVIIQSIGAGGIVVYNFYLFSEVEVASGAEGRFALRHAGSWNVIEIK